MIRWWMLLIALILCATVKADGYFSAVQWPGWRIETDEDALGWRYPVTNMLDGNPRTTWVYDKTLSYQMDVTFPGSQFRHGASKRLTVRTDDQRQVAIDGLGIINGYAKSRDIYRRNNRIRSLSVTLYGKDGRTTVYQLNESLKLQRITFAPTAITGLELRFPKIDAGPDDDLCISELVLFSHGKPIPWCLTPALLTNGSSHGDCGCGGGPDLELRRQDGSLLRSPHSNPITFIAAARQPGSNTMLLSAAHHLYLFNMATAAYRYHCEYQGAVAREGMGWIDAKTARIALEPTLDDTRHRRWYRLTTGRQIRFLPTNLPANNMPNFLPGVQGPNYGA